MTFGSSLGLVIVNYLELDSSDPTEADDDEQAEVSSDKDQNTNLVYDHVIQSILITIYLTSNFISTMLTLAKVVFNLSDELFELRNFWFPKITKITGHLSAGKILTNPTKEKLVYSDFNSFMSHITYIE